MKLSKISYSQDKAVTLLAENQLGPLAPWVVFQDDWILLLQLKGIAGPSTYDYHVEFSAHELALLVENTLIGASDDGTVHTQAKAMGRFIREVLDIKNKPADIE